MKDWVQYHATCKYCAFVLYIDSARVSEHTIENSNEYEDKYIRLWIYMFFNVKEKWGRCLVDFHHHITVCFLCRLRWRMWQLRRDTCLSVASGWQWMRMTKPQWERCQLRDPWSRNPCLVSFLCQPPSLHTPYTPLIHPFLLMFSSTNPLSPFYPDNW